MIARREGCPAPELVTALGDRELVGAEQTRVRAHVRDCADCADQLAGEQQVRSALAGAARPVPEVALLASLAALPAGLGRPTDEPTGEPTDELSERRRLRRVPTYLGAAASVVVLLVGGFAFVGAQTGPDPRPGGVVAVVPAADRLSVEHAASVTEAGFGGAGFAAVSVALTDPVPLAPVSSGTAP